MKKTKITRIISMLSAFALVVSLLSGFQAFAAISTSQNVQECTVTFRNVSSGKMMNTYGGRTSSGTSICLWDFDSTTDQRYRLVYFGSGQYKIYFNTTDKVVDIYRGSSSLKQGQKVDLYTANDDYAQLFYIDLQNDGSCFIRPAANTSLCIGVSNAKNGSQLTVVKFNSNDSTQRWIICDTLGKRFDATAKATTVTSGNSIPQSKLSSIQKRYPENSRPSRSFKYGAYECHGFACEALADYIFPGSGKPSPSNKNYTYHHSTSSDSKISKIRPGDLVRYRGDSGIDHTIVITGIKGNQFIYADCNSDGRNTVHYSRSVSKSSLDQKLKRTLSGQQISTRGYIAHYRYSSY